MKKNKQATGWNRQVGRSLSRRDFLANTALIGAGLAFGTSGASSNQLKENTGGKNQMKTRKLGKLEVSEMGAGCMSISANYGPPAPRDQGINVIRKAYELNTRSWKEAPNATACLQRVRNWASASFRGVLWEWAI